MTTRATRSPRRRTVIALAVVLSVLVAFVIRLVDIQVVNAQQLRAQSLGSLEIERSLYGSRGTITDEDGDVLAGNAALYEVNVDPSIIFSQKPKDSQTLEQLWETQSDQLGEVLGMTGDEVRQAVGDDPDSQYAQLSKGVPTAVYLKIRDLGFPFMDLREHPARTYPDGAVAGNVVGFVGSDGTPLAGLESAQNECLAATTGKQRYERGKDGVIIPGTLSETPAVDGGDLRLTIDGDLQWYMQQLIAEQVQDQRANYGTIFVVEVSTGKVRAAAEYPSVDPNNINASDPADLGNRTFSFSFEPGSTFKPVTAATIIEEGKASPTEPIIPAAGRETLNGITINDVFPHSSYNYTLAGALVDSSNVALSKFGDLVPEKTRHDYLDAFGVGHGTAIGFPGEAKGVLHDTPWDDASHWTSTFGQSFTVTVPQVASVYQTIANGGVQLPLRLVESCTSADGSVSEPDLPKPKRVISESTADQVTLMLENVYQQVTNHNTIEIPGYRAATKTGTAQKSDGQGGYKRGIYYTTMVGFAPADDPKYVVVLTLDEPQKTRLSAANAPGWQKAMTQVLKNYHVLPSATPGPEILPKYQ